MQSGTIVVTGGGTAGHVFPAFPVVERLQKRGWEILWLGSLRGMERRLVSEAGIAYRGLPSGKFRRNWSFRNLTDLFCIALGCVLSLILFIRRRPALVFSKGGYVSVPPVMAARILRIQVLAHESDADPGLATRLSLYFGAKPLLAYEHTRSFLNPGAAGRAVVVGNPVRDEIFRGEPEQGRRIAGLDPGDDRPLLLVLGGSLGAGEINGLVLDSLDRLLEKCAIVHQTGRNFSAPETRSLYTPKPFFSGELPHLLAAADLAVSRSGAGLLWELAATATPTFFVPLRTLTRGDQIRNAEIARSAGMALVAEPDIDAATFADTVITLLDDDGALDAMRRAASAFPARQAADRVSRILMEELE